MFAKVIEHGRRRGRFGCSVERLGGVALPVTQAVDRRVVGQREEPRGELVAWPVRTDALVDAHENFLRDVVGVAGIVEQPVDEVDHGTLVARHEFVERGFLAASQPLGQF